MTDAAAAIASALEDLSVPTLMLSLVHLKGDPKWIRGDIKPQGLFLNEVQGFMPEEMQAEARKLALKRGVAFGQFAELAKQVYVDVAKKDFVVSGRRMTVSRVAVLTGLTRKESRRLFDVDPLAGAPDPRRRINRAARFLSAWV